MQPNLLAFLHQIGYAYEDYCQPLCRRLQITRTAFDILMFLSNHPEYNTAKDITAYRGIKANLVSFTVERLVKEGYLERHPVPGDRRKVGLSCTEKARPIITEGAILQQEFSDSVTQGMTPEEVQNMTRYIGLMQKNIIK